MLTEAPDSGNVPKCQPADLYLDLLKRCLTYSLWGESTQPADLAAVLPGGTRFLFGKISSFLKRHDLEVVKKFSYDADARARGRDWPPLADTMIGLKRLDNLQMCIEQVIKDQIPGDLIETGVWRGGGSIFMRAVLKAHQVTDRTVWVADSFAGLPPPDPKRYPEDAGDAHHAYAYLRVSCEEVKNNFRRYGLLDGQVRFLEGWFKDTLPAAPISRLAVVRLDGDMYESTLDGLTHLYPKLSAGGYLIVDDYVLGPCRKAVHDYRDRVGIREEILDIDGIGAYWRKAP